MRINLVEIQNFRKLKSVRIELSSQSTIFVGANNSGKTSAIIALGHFLVDQTRFSPKDFTLSNWQNIDGIGKTWIDRHAEGDTPDLDRSHWGAVVPTMDVWLEVGLHEVHIVSHLVPTLDWSGGLLGLRLAYEPIDVDGLFTEFVTVEKAARETMLVVQEQSAAPEEPVKLWPRSLSEFLGKRLGKHFKIHAYLLNPSQLAQPVGGIAQPQQRPQFNEALDVDPLKGIIRIHEINAQRGFSDRPDRQTGSDRDETQSTGQPGDRHRLSRQLRSYYHNHIDPEVAPSPSDIGALQAINTAETVFDQRLQDGLSGPLKELSQLGYPGVTDPSIVLSTKIRPIEGLDHPSAVQYDVASTGNGLREASAPRLPEDAIGLGFQNLISMVFQLMQFRDSWMRVGKAGKRVEIGRERDEYFPAPIHLVMIEEPEAHLHAQVQQVFIRHAYNVLRNHPDLGDHKALTTQLVISTHSSHIAHECTFSDLRYFRRLPAGHHADIPTSCVMNLSTVFGTENQTQRFVTRYLRTTHCDLFFADAVILIEGTAERMMIPHFIRNKFRQLHERYVSLLEISGSHAHRLRTLLELLRIPTLIVADIDPMVPEPPHKKAWPIRNNQLQTRNQTLKEWIPRESSFDALIDLEDNKKVLEEDSLFAIRVAYQVPIQIQTIQDQDPDETLAATFEDALVYQNLEVFRNFSGAGPIKKFKDAIDSAVNSEALVADVSKALEGITKAEFALDLLDMDKAEELDAPHYIATGLSWLQDHLDRTLREVVPPAESAPSDQGDEGSVDG